MEGKTSLTDKEIIELIQEIARLRKQLEIEREMRKTLLTTKFGNDFELVGQRKRRNR